MIPFRLGAFAKNAEEEAEPRYVLFLLPSIPSAFRSVEYMGTLLRIANAPLNPPAFFSWAEPASGIQLPPTNPWPKNGYSFICWLRIENFPVGTSMLPLYGISWGRMKDLVSL